MNSLADFTSSNARTKYLYQVRVGKIKDRLTTPMGRFMRFVSPQTTGCWLWTGTKTLGYGRFFSHHSRQVGAHRQLYEWMIGPITADLQIDHLCRNPSCVNPSHLEIVTSRENTLRGTSPAALNAKKTHCLRGHPFDAENTIYRPSSPTQRGCKRCGNEQAVRFHRNRKAAR